MSKQEKTITYSNRVPESVHKELIAIGSKTINDILIKTVEYQSDLNVPILIKSNELKKLKNEFSKNQQTIETLKKEIKDLEKSNSLLNEEIKAINIEYRELLDIQAKDKKEFENTYNKLLELINNGLLDDKLEDIFCDIDLIKRNNIIRSLIKKVSNNGNIEDKEHIVSSLENCIIYEGFY